MGIYRRNVAVAMIEERLDVVARDPLRLRQRGGRAAQVVRRELGQFLVFNYPPHRVAERIPGLVLHALEAAGEHGPVILALPEVHGQN